MKILTIGKATIPLHDGTLGVSVSGGADSAAMLYILMKHMDPEQKLRIYCFGKTPTHYSAIAGAQVVARRCSELTGFVNYEVIADHGPDQYREVLFKNISEDIKAGVITHAYTGITANPPKDIGDSFLGEEFNQVHEARNPEITREETVNEVIHTPFTNINKQDIAQIYRELDIEDTVYPYTRSCESFDPVHLGTHCGECWWCLERKWGFGHI